MLYDTAPHRLDLPEKMQHMVLKIPRSALSERMASAESQLASRLDGRRPEARLLAAMLSTLAMADDELPAVTGDLVGEQLLDLTVRLRAAAAQLRPTQLSETRSLLWSRIRLHGLAQLSDQTLSVASVATAFGMTSRAVSALFADNGATLSRHIGAQRLERCRKALYEPVLVSCLISEIAFGNGFLTLRTSVALSAAGMVQARASGVSARAASRTGSPRRAPQVGG